MFQRLRVTLFYHSLHIMSEGMGWSFYQGLSVTLPGEHSGAGEVSVGQIQDSGGLP